MVGKGTSAYQGGKDTPVQEKTVSEESAGTPAEIRTLWQRITGNGHGVPLAVRLIAGAIIVAVLMVVTVSLYDAVPAVQDPGPALDIPAEWNKGWDVIKAIDGAVDWVIINGEPFFDVIQAIVIGILRPFRDFLRWIPWWLFVAAVALVSWRMVNVWLGALSVGFLAFIMFMGLFDMAMITLAIVLTATVLCVALGIPVGIASAKSNRLERIMRPILDMMQTMPSFVYLIPALMLFGLGMVPAVMSTCIYAIPPIIRLTNLGIRQVDSQTVEAARSFGTTSRQLLTKVQVPLAMPTILAGLNQTVMMALAMVVLASMIGAGGLGVEVLNGIARVEPGRGFIGGIAIVFMAIVLDRVSQGLAKQQPGIAPTQAA